MGLHVGDKAPEFALPSSAGGEVSLAGLRGKKVVLYFYPKDNTPGCIKEACGFRDADAELNEAGLVVLGVSADSIESHDKFAAKFGLDFPLLSDAEKIVSIAYGAWGEKNVYGKKTIGMKRMTFLIDEEGRLARVWPRVKPEGHAREVLEAALAA
mgnify:CR=1 FL=1